MQLVNAQVGSWPIVAGTGSWLEAHLVARLALVARVPNICGSGIDEQEVWGLVRQQARESEKRQDRETLVLPTDSIAVDQGRRLIRRLRRSRARMLILVLVQQDHWLTAEALSECEAQAIVHVESVGSGTLIRALQALRRGRIYIDPRLQEQLHPQPTIA
jgi:DNA-binding NarL/FixJ family response regulator